MDTDGFYSSEVRRLDQEVRFDSLRSEEYKKQFADIVKSSDRKSILAATELSPKPIKKPFRLRFREFIEKLKKTI